MDPVSERAVRKDKNNVFHAHSTNQRRVVTMTPASVT